MGRRKFYLLHLIPTKHTVMKEANDTHLVLAPLFSHWLSHPFGVIAFNSTKASTELGSYFAFLQLPF